MSDKFRTLKMRANRLLGAQLVEHNLVKIEDLELANEKFIEVVATDVVRLTTILGILAYDMKVLKEDDALHHIVETEGLGLVDLRDYDVPDELKKNLDVEACWATWSVPYDREEEFFFVATAYYLSPAVRSYWEKELGGPILWFGATLDGIADYLEKHTAAVGPVVPGRNGTQSPIPPGTRSPLPGTQPPTNGSRPPMSGTKSPIPVPVAVAK